MAEKKNSDGVEVAIVDENDGSSMMVVPDTQVVGPIMTVDDAVEQVQMMRDFRKRVLVKGSDYGKIPGCGPKPTLLKPGAEKLVQMFGFSVEFERTTVIENFDPDDAFFYYCYRCDLRNRNNGVLVASQEGSANSRESKWIKADPFNVVNTLQKMAQKRAMVGAVLIATRASEEFTQDVEDMNIGNQNQQQQQPRQTAPQTDEEKQFAEKRSAASKDFTLIPFGQEVGKPLADCSDEHLIKMADWCDEKGKFEDHAKEMRRIVDQRPGEEG